jgi:hypothetical protein
MRMRIRIRRRRRRRRRRQIIQKKTFSFPIQFSIIPSSCLLRCHRYSIVLSVRERERERKGRLGRVKQPGWNKTEREEGERNKRKRRMRKRHIK